MTLILFLFILHFTDYIFGSSVNIEDDFLSLQDACRKLKEHMRQLKYTLQELRDDNEKLSYKLRNLKQYVFDVDSYYRIDNLEILGVPKTEDEDLLETLHNISLAISIPFNVSEISSVWRRQEVSGRNYYKQTKLDSIIVRFVSRSTRNKWLNRGRKSIAISSKQCFPQLPESEIYINEHLSNTKKGLVKIAKELEEQNKILYAWLKDGNLYIRMSPNGKAIKVKSHNDLQLLGLVR